jgi:hypothetical protein
MRSKVNRAQRRGRRKAPPAFIEYARTYRCPDCLSETAYPLSDRHGIWHIEVRHDDTCPTYIAMRRNA